MLTFSMCNCAGFLLWHLPGSFYVLILILFIAIFWLGIWSFQQEPHNLHNSDPPNSNIPPRSFHNVFLIAHFNLIWADASLLRRGDSRYPNIVVKYWVCTHAWVVADFMDLLDLCSLHGSPLNFQLNVCHWVFRAFNNCCFNNLWPWRQHRKMGLLF